MTKIERDGTQRYLVRTNEVAPIIIRNCKEEYQHVVDFKEPVVYGKIAENMPEHALVRVSVPLNGFFKPFKMKKVFHFRLSSK